VNCVRARWPHACRSERYRDGRPRLSAATLVAAITRTWACQAPAIPSHRRRAQNSRDSPVPRMRTPLLAVRARRVLRSRAAVRRWADVSHSSLDGKVAASPDAAGRSVKLAGLVANQPVRVRRASRDGPEPIPPISRICKCGNVSRLVHCPRALLAGGVIGGGRVPGRVDPSDSIPHRGHGGRWRARGRTRHRHASGQGAARPARRVMPPAGRRSPIERRRCVAWRGFPGPQIRGDLSGVCFALESCRPQ
jgi:hypothetical protein